MMTDEDVRSAVDRLATKVADLDADVRVTKHNVANMQMNTEGLARKLEKLEDRMGTKFEDLTKTVHDKFEAVIKEIGAVNMKQERGAGFYAGMAAVIGVMVSLLAVLAKFLFGGS